MSGSDNGPLPLIEASKEYLKSHNDVFFFCVGKKEELSALEGIKNVEIVDAREVMKMDEDPFHAIKNKESSMIKAFNVLKDNNCDAIISCGGTGAYLTSATLILGRISNVRRPCLVTPFPTKIKGKYTVILDVGANNKNTSEELVQFAKMGSIYYKVVFNSSKADLYLLSNGSEDHKGTPEIVETNKLLREINFEGFKGNMEARDVLSGEADVVVCDGFSGNVFLKTSEGVFKIVGDLLKSGFKSSLKTKIGYLLSKSVLKNFKDTFDYKSVGGAMLLGVKGVVVKAHGNSDVKSVLGAYNVAYKLVSNQINKRIENEITKEK